MGKHTGPSLRRKYGTENSGEDSPCLRTDIELEEKEPFTNRTTVNPKISVVIISFQVKIDEDRKDSPLFYPGDSGVRLQISRRRFYFLFLGKETV